MHRRENRRPSRLRRGATSFALAGLVVAAAAPSSAIASTAFVDSKCDSKKPNVCTYAASFRSAAGETNDVTVKEFANDRFSFADLGSAITPGTGCSPAGPNRVVCNARALVADRGNGPTRTTIDPANVQTGELDDAVDTTGRSRVFGGSGDDTLRVFGIVHSTLSGGTGNDRVTSEASAGQTLGGNDGADKVIGGSGRDTARGGSGDDTVLGRGNRDLLSGNSGNDQVLGGTGSDRLFGRSGNDRLFGNEGNDGLQGNSGRDGLAGGSGADRLTGSTGGDRLFGNSGSDRLRGNSGRDRYRAGSGDDFIRSVDNLAERVNGGAGTDVAVVDRIDNVVRCSFVVRR